MNSENPPYFCLEGIEKKFPGVHALKNIDFDLKKGECVALLGENGAGKSTLIKIMGGAQRADSGEPANSKSGREMPSDSNCAIEL